MLSIAVLIPTYDRPAKLDRALRSCFEQSVPPAQVVVVDNGANPQTPQVIARFQERHGDRLVYEKTEPLKVRVALARGIELLRGDWMIQLDDDDFLVPGRIERDLRKLETVADDVVMLGHHFVRVDYRQRIAWMHRIDARKLTLQNALCFDHFGPLAMASWRTATVQAHHPLRQAEGAPDYDWISSLLQHGHATAIDDMAYVQDDTRAVGGTRLTSATEGMIPLLKVHAARYKDCEANPPVDHAHVARRLEQQIAFHAGKSLRARTFGSPYAGLAWRHPVEFAKGFVSPLRPPLSRLLGNALPEIRGSTVRTFEALAREQPELAAWILKNEILPAPSTPATL